MALDRSNSSSLEQLASKGLTAILASGDVATHFQCSPSSIEMDRQRRSCEYLSEFRESAQNVSRCGRQDLH